MALAGLRFAGSANSRGSARVRTNGSFGQSPAALNAQQRRRQLADRGVVELSVAQPVCAEPALAEGRTIQKVA
jgi:hypothetical protein